MILNRLKTKVNMRLSMDQCAYRAGFGIEDCLFVIDSLLSQADAYKFSVWAASLDMRKAFDRVEHKIIFEALRYYGIDEGMIALIQISYIDQYGTMDGKHYFEITRGVRQGDVLSTLLFNVVLEYAFDSWKSKLNTEGWKLDASDSYLINLRFADDILILARCKSDLCSMLDKLLIEFQRIGLEVNRSKTKILTNEDGDFREDVSTIIPVGNQFFHVIGKHEWHKYLGKHLCFCCKHRADIEIQHRIAAAWAKFHQKSYIFKT